jgi:hypothetical protein
MKRLTMTNTTTPELPRQAGVRANASILTVGVAMAATIAVSCLLSRGSDAQAAEAPPAEEKRSIAVLEYRAGVEEAEGITSRLAKLLQKKTSLAVLDAAEGRRRLGTGLDGAVADCGGKSACVAEIGKKLRVDEVLLVGLTKLGDVIVALARIETATGKVAGRVGLTKAPGEPLARKDLLKALKQLLPPSDFIRYGSIRVRSNVAGALVRVGGKDYGRTPLQKNLRVRAPASYEIRVRKKGYMEFSADLDVPPEATITVDAKLIPKGAAPGPPVYKTWWFWTVLGGSVVAAVAGTVAGVVLYRQSQSQPATVVVDW